MATHGYTLSQAAEDRITDALPALAIHMPEGPYLWNALREVLLGPHAAHALRTMHALGVLEMLLPEFHGIDALVIRDSYHRYTVDEHTFLTIDNVHGCASRRTTTNSAWRTCCPRLIGSTCSCSRCCCTTPAKAGARANTRPERRAGRRFMARLDFDAEERETVLRADQAAPRDVERSPPRHLRRWRMFAALPKRSAAPRC